MAVWVIKQVAEANRLATEVDKQVVVVDKQEVVMVSTKETTLALAAVLEEGLDDPMCWRGQTSKS